MNKITTTAGVLALGAVALQAQQFAGPAGSPANQKPWSISATLRGFYDDNNLLLSDRDPRKEDTFGVEVSPTAALNLVREQTTVGLAYQYSMRWFEARPNNQIDHSHIFNAKLSHAFTERYKVDVTDSFVVAQEPTVLSEGIIPLPLRAEGDNIRNTVRASFAARLTENLETVLGYENHFWDYESSGPGSHSAVLDRVENLFSLDFRQVLLPQTVGIAGYRFGIIDYTADEFLSVVPSPSGLLFRSSIRDAYTHYFYVGADHKITQTFNVAARVGAQYTDYHRVNGLPGVQESAWGPYADANATWTYLQGSYAQLGVRHQRTATDISFLTGGVAPTMDAQATTVYGSLHHRLWGAFSSSLIAQYQHTTFEGGLADGLSDDYWGVGVNFTYDINTFLAAEVGYNYDRLESDIADSGINPLRQYDRNRVYVGIRATY